MAVSRSTVKVGEYLDDWFATARTSLRPTTACGYEQSIRRLTRFLGNYQLQSLTPMQVQRCYTDLLENGGHGGGPLAPKTARHAHVVLRKSLAEFRLLAATGLRRGEVLGLRWSDVDFDLGQLAVANTITEVGADTVMGPPKTARSRRNVYLDRRTMTAVREHRQRQRELRLAAGPAWVSSHDWVR